MSPITTFVSLAAVFAAKHFLADFVVQTEWMARGKQAGAGWVAPLAVHAGCHCGLTLLIALAVAPHLWPLALLDFALHFSVDRAKAVVTTMSRLTPQQARYWWLFGFDQLLHQLTDIMLVAALLSL